MRTAYRGRSPRTSPERGSRTGRSPAKIERVPGEGVPTAREADRIVWPDAAKAVCIVLVVLFHTTTKHYEGLRWGVPEEVQFAWSVLTDGLRPVRMPLFFLISGWFAARAVHRPLREVVARRVVLNYWVYVVWLLITTAVFALMPSFPVYRADDLPGLLLALVLGWTSLWYLYALPVYFLLVRAMVPLPLPVAFGVALAAAVAADLPAVPGRGDTDGLLANLVFFLLGALTPQVVTALVARSGLLPLAGAAAVYAVALALAVGSATDRAVGVSTVLGLLGAGVGVLGFVQLSAWLPGLARTLARLGRRTLPVYVLHMPLLAVLDTLVDRLDVRTTTPGPLLVAALYPALATGLLTGLCLLVHRLLRAAGLRVLFELPRVRRGTRPAEPPLTVVQ